MRQITVTVHREEDSWWADSVSVPGFSAAAETLEKLRDEIRQGVAFAIDDEPHVIVEAPDSEAWKPVFPVLSSGGGRVVADARVTVTYQTASYPAAAIRTNPRLVLA